jgi:uncharacterized protein (DUF58 family)
MPATNPVRPSGHDPGSRTARRIQIRASRLVTGIFAGEYRSAFRGRGIEFDEVRDYQPGDDIRSIDWNVTARLDRPFVKRFVEERELTLLILLDRSASMDFGTLRATKGETAAELTALLAFAAFRSNDRVGLVTYTDRVDTCMPPAKGKRHVLGLVRQAMEPVSAGKAADLSAVLEYVRRVTKGRALLFIISDFLCEVPVPQLAALAGRHEVVAVSVSDPAESQLPAGGLLQLRDAETGALSLVDTGSEMVRRSYRLRASERQAGLKSLLTSAGAELLTVDTRIPPLHPLVRFFKNRLRKRMG